MLVAIEHRLKLPSNINYNIAKLTVNFKIAIAIVTYIYVPAGI